LSPVLGDEKFSLDQKEDEEIIPSIDSFTKENREFKSPKRQRRYTIQN
jgi:hypothetical protein